MYSVMTYGEMIADSIRMSAYTRALERAVYRDSVVLDIGTGIGIFAFLACKYGARKVYAIDPSDAIQVARDVADINGLSGRIEFIQDFSERVTLPEKADVIISDLRGIFPLYGNNIRTVIDARQRFLAPQGVLIPQSDLLFTAVVNAPKLYADYAEPWDSKPFGLDFEPARSIAMNSWRKGRVEQNSLLTPPQQWGHIDYTTIQQTNIRSSISWTSERSGVGHGIAVWFDSILSEGITMTNAPYEPRMIYSSAFFPFLNPINLESGDRVSLSMSADLVGEDYIWTWKTETFSGSSGSVKASYEQSTFSGEPITAASLRKKSATFMPVLNEEGQIDARIISLMQQNMMLKDIALQVQEDFPHRFSSFYQALSHVGELASKYA